ncbi:EmrB/QacA subfamily drug resistance transporter [Catenulispora sp. GAS73]|uniref:MFS transporter n=1 Tax=Catenulispora sp. GAS73 TaxID=3156269 RepID=UPI00351447D7
MSVVDEQPAGVRAASEPPARAGLVLGVACQCQLMVVLDISVVNVALPRIGADLGFAPGSLSWVVNAYTLVFGGLLLLGGRIADLVGHRRTLVVALAAFGLASVLGGLATSPGELIAARGGQGLAAAVLAPVTLTVILVTFPEGPARRRAIAVWSMVAAAGSAFGVLLSGVLTEYLDWRWVLFVNVPIVALALPLALAGVRDLRRPGTGRLDVVGAVLVTASMTLLVLATVYAGEHGWSGVTTLLGLIGSVVSAAGFVFWELRVASQPLLRFGIFRVRTVWVADLIVVFIGAATLGGFYFASLFLQEVLHYSPVKAGAAFLPFCAGIVVGSFTSAKLAARFGNRVLLSAGSLLGAAGMLGFALLDTGSTFWSFLVPSLVASVGIGTCMVANTAMGTSGVAPQEAGLVSGLLNTSRQVGASVALAVLTTVAVSTTHHDNSLQALSRGYSHAFAVAGSFVLVAALVAVLFVPGRPTAVAAD